MRDPWHSIHNEIIECGTIADAFLHFGEKVFYTDDLIDRLDKTRVSVQGYMQEDPEELIAIKLTCNYCNLIVQSLGDCTDYNGMNMDKVYAELIKMNWDDTSSDRFVKVNYVNLLVPALYKKSATKNIDPELGFGELLDVL